MPHRLSNWSFPASLVPPWCLAGCPFLPPWCLPGASQAVQLILSCLPGASQAVQLVLSCLPGASLVSARLSKWSFPAGDPPGSAPLPRVYPPLSKFQWRPARFVPNPGVGPTAGFPYRKTAFKWPLGAPVAQNCLSKASRSTDPSSTAPKVCFGPGGPPHGQTLNGSSLLSCARPQRLPTVGVAVSLRRFVSLQRRRLCAQRLRKYLSLPGV